MDRNPPSAFSDELDLYVRTYYSLLRSSGDVRVRALEEAHCSSGSSLHSGAEANHPDIAAFAYCAARLPSCMPVISRLIMGQSREQFEAAGFAVEGWIPVRARGRRRAMRFDGKTTLALFINSASDIDDLIPIVTAYQLEWNKLHDARKRFPNASLAQAASLDDAELDRLRAAFGAEWSKAESDLHQKKDLSIRLLDGSFSEYQSTAQRWWSGIESAYRQPDLERQRPVYFVSSNTHALANLVAGYATAHRDAIIAFAREQNPEDLVDEIDNHPGGTSRAGAENNVLYYLLRAYLHEPGQAAQRHTEVQAYDRESGVHSVESPGKIDVDAQVIELAKLRPERLDPRVRVDGIDGLRRSDAVIINIDYPLGMAAYHHLSRLAQGVATLRGAYVMGKAATLNGRVGDVMILKATHDEHSKNTYLLSNCFAAADVQPYMMEGSVFDNQKAVTVRSPFLQNHNYMSGLYRKGYTMLEMEAGPYLSAMFELQSPVRHPNNEVINLSQTVPFDVGFLHYASDTPYSRRQSLLSKSMSYFGVESSYACAIAILRRIFASELEFLNKV